MKEYKAFFKTRYAPGTLTAVIRDEKGEELGSSMLHSAKEPLNLVVQPERSVAQPGEVVFIPVQITGQNGVVESNADRVLKVSIRGGELLSFGSANPRTEEKYDTGSFTTWRGRALVVRVGQSGETSVVITGDGLQARGDILVCNNS